MQYLSIVCGYLLGSIPTSLVLGKLFFKTDIREHGSHNLGGTNAARVLGFRIGALVIILDALKALASVYIGSRFSPVFGTLAGLAACVGHCYPIFANFRGGKAVACTFGYFLGLGAYITDSYLMFILAISVFAGVLYKFRMVSFASLISLAVGSAASIYQGNTLVMFCASAAYILVVYRHRENIERIRNNTESKISFGSKK
ncbi:MAG: glycerol-3-phosphate 1-O-acyltransferase PlsY [Erysipelotrichaceae bacterium]|nr:glycerol-3-phosphate 1-O-acyltransferase PlsY [Erysipelotrichaceae bacterium]